MLVAIMKLLDLSTINNLPRLRRLCVDVDYHILLLGAQPSSTSVKGDYYIGAEYPRLKADHTQVKEVEQDKTIFVLVGRNFFQICMKELFHTGSASIRVIRVEYETQGPHELKVSVFFSRDITLIDKNHPKIKPYEVLSVPPSRSVYPSNRTISWL